MNYLRSPLIQKDIKNSNEVDVEMDYSYENKQVIKKYETLINEYYKETMEGQFEDATAAILERI